MLEVQDATSQLFRTLSDPHILAAASKQARMKTKPSTPTPKYASSFSTVSCSSPTNIYSSTSPTEIYSSTSPVTDDESDAHAHTATAVESQSQRLLSLHGKSSDRANKDAGDESHSQIEVVTTMQAKMVRVVWSTDIDGNITPVVSVRTSNAVTIESDVLDGQEVETCLEKCLEIQISVARPDVPKDMVRRGNSEMGVWEDEREVEEMEVRDVREAGDATHTHTRDATLSPLSACSTAHTELEHDGFTTTDSDQTSPQATAHKSEAPSPFAPALRKHYQAQQRSPKSTQPPHLPQPQQLSQLPQPPLRSICTQPLPDQSQPSPHTVPPLNQQTSVLR